MHSERRESPARSGDGGDRSRAQPQLDEAHRAVLESLCKGVRTDAARKRLPALRERAPTYGRWLALLHEGETLVLVVARDSGVELRRLGGHAVVVPRGELGMRCPSRACALYLASICERYTGIVPSDRAVRRAMAILQERSREQGAP